MQMDEKQLVDMIDSAVSESVEYMNPIYEKAQQADDYYTCAARGDEEPGYSTYTSSQVADLIDSDMPTLARVFLGAGQAVEFMPQNPNDEKDAKEAQQKTIYTDGLIKSVPNYYRIMHSALMGAVLHPISVVRYGFQEKKVVRIKEHDRVTIEELTALDDRYRRAYDKVEFLEYEKEEEGEYSDGVRYCVKFKLTKEEESQPYMRRLPIADFIMSFDATSKADARLIGERVLTRRGDLLAAGHSREQLDLISTASRSAGSNDGTIFTGVNAGISSVRTEWASELVEGFDGFIRCDYDGDGIIETRHVIKYGEVVLENEEVEDDPRCINFAMGSASLVPDNIVGISRAERVVLYQDAMTTISRAMLDNTAQITRGRMLVNTSTDMGLNFHDVTGDGSIIRANPMTGMSLGEAALPLMIQPVSQEALTVIQYLDSQRAQSTGGLMANQGLKEDSLHKETATRFKGVDDSAQAKMELVLRTLAETLIRELYEGFCYYSQKYRMPEREVQILGEGMKISPASWGLDHSCQVTVGTGYGNNEKTIESMGSLLNVSATLQGTGISDGKKLYNLVAKLARASGIYNVSDYFNDPERPAQMLQAENEALKQQLTQLQQQVQAIDPMLQLEQIRGQAKVESARLAAQVDMLKLELDKQKAIAANALELTKLEIQAGKQLDSEFKQNQGDF